MRRASALSVMLASGFAGLGYQIVWTQQFATWLGHESAAVLAVVAAFFGGLAAGAFVLGGPIERSARPLRWYAACELAIAAWSVALAFGLAPAGERMLALLGPEAGPLRQWCVAFAGTFLLLLPATAAMGGTLPAMERALRGTAWPRGTLARVYASNTFGAVLGVLATTFALVPSVGLRATALACAALNVLCAAWAWRVDVVGDAAGAGASGAGASGVGASGAPRSGRGVPARERVAAPALAVLAITGLLGIGYEVLVVRVLSQVCEDTVFTFALLLAVYLVGTAAGAAAYARGATRVLDAATTRRRLLVAQSLACLLGTGTLWAAEFLRDAVSTALGGGYGPALVAEAALAVAAFLLPTLVMGALFAHFCEVAVASGAGFGRALAWNTLGACLAPLLAGVALAPALGPKAALLLATAGYLALALALGGAWRQPLPWVAAAACAGVAALAPPLAFVDVPPGGRVLEYREGAMAAVSVVEDAEGVARLRINNRQQEGSSATGYADGRQALLPLLLHPAPVRALFLGLGTGVTARTAAADEALSVDAVELLPEVVAASARFANDGTPARLHVHVADARRYVRAAHDRYDLVVADNFHPARSGSAALYTVEHFRAVRARLAPDGVFCQWLPLHQLDLRTLRSIVRSYLEAFPHASAMLATHSLETPVLGLVARADDRGFAPRDVRARLATFRAPWPAADFGFDDEYAVLGSFVAGHDALARFAGDAPANTDDRPVVAYRAPRVTYAPDSAPRERLAALLAKVQPATDAVLAHATPTERARLIAYWRARDRFLAAGRDVRPVSDPVQMLAQVREPLLAVLRTSADFRPAYDPLLRLAAALASADPARARALLEELQRLQPARRDAADVLARLEVAR